jgi:hypothetical protein
MPADKSVEVPRTQDLIDGPGCHRYRLLDAADRQAILFHEGREITAGQAIVVAVEPTIGALASHHVTSWSVRIRSSAG